MLCKFAFRCPGARAVNLEMISPGESIPLQNHLDVWETELDLNHGYHYYRFRINGRWALNDHRSTVLAHNDHEQWSLLLIHPAFGPLWQDKQLPVLDTSSVSVSDPVARPVQNLAAKMDSTLVVRAMVLHVLFPSLIQLVIQDPAGELRTCQETFLDPSQAGDQFQHPLTIRLPPPPGGWSTGIWQLHLKSTDREVSTLTLSVA